MSFAFNAVGTKDAVVAQLSNIYPAGVPFDDQLGSDLVAVLKRHFELEASKPWTAAYEYQYVVRASGQSGSSSPIQIRLEIEALCIQRIEDVRGDDEEGDVNTHAYCIDELHVHTD